jgi:hypothetical protein
VAFPSRSSSELKQQKGIEHDRQDQGYLEHYSGSSRAALGSSGILRSSTGDKSEQAARRWNLRVEAKKPAFSSHLPHHEFTIVMAIWTPGAEGASGETGF